ncbi:MAG: cph1 3 [Marmoricola sp.]|nr:cph1 3 [Marmoricola sp.]
MSLSPRDLEREAELLRYHAFEEPPIAMLQELVEFVATGLGHAVAEINVVTATEAWHLVTSDGRGGVRRPRGDGICGRVVGFDGPTFVMPDAREHPDFRDEPYVNGETATLVSYAGTHLVSDRGIVLGTLCVYDFDQVDFADDQVELLESLGRTVSSVLAMHSRTTELATTLGRLTDSHRALNTSNESLEAFAGQISHDLRTPLSSLSLALGLLVEHPNLVAAPESSDELFLLRRAMGGAERMSQMIEDLMDFATLGGETREEVDLELVAAQVITDLVAIAGDADIVVGSLPRVWSTPSQVRAVLQNLVANALKFSAGGHDSTLITIDGFVVGESATIRISDNGPGVPVEERSKVFEQMVRGSDADVEGYGIGLATCARIVEAHGGDIWVDDAPGGGAAFWFSLPTGPVASR